MRNPESGATVSWLSAFPAQFRRKISQGVYRPEIDGLRFFAIAFVILIVVLLFRPGGILGSAKVEKV